MVRDGVPELHTGVRKGEEMPTHRGSWPFRNKVLEKDQYHQEGKMIYFVPPICLILYSPSNRVAGQVGQFWL